MSGYALIIETTSFITPAIKMEGILIYPIRFVFPFAPCPETIRWKIVSPLTLVPRERFPFSSFLTQVMSIIFFLLDSQSWPAYRSKLHIKRDFLYLSCFNEWNSRCNYIFLVLMERTTQLFSTPLGRT